MPLNEKNRPQHDGRNAERAWRRQDQFVLTACRMTRMRSMP